MPLSVRARIEVYLPDQPTPAYQDLLRTLVDEFTTTFGGCSVIRGVDGTYLSNFGEIIADRISVIYTGTSFDFKNHSDEIARYADKLRSGTFKALNEEAILVVVWPVYHSV